MTMAGALPPVASTDPWERTELPTATREPEPDRLLDRPSSTPLMTSYAGWVRFVAMLGIAAFFIYGKSRHRDDAIDTVYGGLKFPPEVRIYGSTQFVVGGGAAPFGAVAVYVKQRPKWVTSPPSSEWAALDRFAKSALDNLLIDEFFSTLASVKLDKAALLQFDGRTTVDSLKRDVRVHLANTLSEDGVEAVLQAFDTTMAETSQPFPEGAQLYLACTPKQVHLAYGLPAVGKLLRDTATVAASIDEAGYSAAGMCQELFSAFFSGPKPLAPLAKAGVAAGFSQQYGRYGDEHIKSEL